MWSDSPTTIVGGSCEFANAAQGGIEAPSATSPYIARRAYCAADDALYRAGAACGSCFKVSYDGSPATDQGRPGSLVVQIVDSGSAKTFDCQVDAFEAITGARTGIFPITYEPVDCELNPASGPVATVLDGMNAWYTKVIFSNLPQAVDAAEITVEDRPFSMSRVGGATWQASPGGATGVAGFALRLDGGAVVCLDACFGAWPVATTASCAGEAAPEPEPEPEQEDGAQCVKSGDTVFLRAHTGKRLTAQGTAVHAKWNHQGGWQEWTIERVGGGDVSSGDVVYLKAHTGKRLTVQGTQVHAKWSHQGSWQRFTIEREVGGGKVSNGDSVLLRAHTGKYLTVQGRAVHAKWAHRGAWQRFVVEKKD